VHARFGSSLGMKMVMLVCAGTTIVAVVLYWVFFPRNKFVSFYFPGGRILRFSSGGVKFQAAPNNT
jgi:hypothetical protein